MSTTETPAANLAKQSVSLDKPSPNAKTIIDILSGSAMADRLKAVASKHLPAEKLIKMIGVQMQRTPKLGFCTPISVFECAMTLSELGLSTGVLGDAHLIPYKETCTVIIGYRGLLKLARRSGQIATIQAAVVRQGDEFRYRKGTDPVIEHVEIADPEAPMTHAWAMAKFKDGSFQFEVMRAVEVEAIKRKSKGAYDWNGNPKKDSPWHVPEFEPEMWKKTALRRLCKMLPLSAEVEMAIDVIDRTEYAVVDRPALTARPQPTPDAMADEIGRQMEGLREKQEQAREEDTRTEPDEKGGEPQGQDESDEANKRREKLKEQAEEIKGKGKEKPTPKPAPVGCAIGQPGCSEDPADYRVENGVRRCANHATMGGDQQGTLMGGAETTKKKR